MTQKFIPRGQVVMEFIGTRYWEKSDEHKKAIQEDEEYGDTF